LIFDAAASVESIGPLVETLKWGQPAYLPERPRTGSTIRVGPIKRTPHRYALFVHCQTTLIDDFRQIYRDQLTFEGNRALVLRHGDPLPRAALQHCVSVALTYHLKPGRAAIPRSR